MTDNDCRQRILGIIRTIRRPGTEAVINYLETSSYFRIGCYSHHKEEGGLAQHSFEVYEHMLSHANGYPSDSIAVVGLFHDLGKTAKRDGRGHGQRSVDILDRCGFPLFDEERTAIARHHDRALDLLRCPIRRYLTAADCFSTGNWKRAHPELCGHHRSHRNSR